MIDQLELVTNRNTERKYVNKINRRPLPAISLATDISTILACGNDFSFTKVFSRNLEALGKKNDILI